MGRRGAWGIFDRKMEDGKMGRELKVNYERLKGM
jgi:hypothetical protein